MTLSIGDGANDVAMIQEANVGCGLLGLEGSQAAMSADYAFAQFRFLTKLIVVHGHWSYLRIANMHKNFFYKNVVWTLAMFWYLFYNRQVFEIVGLGEPGADESASCNSFDATYLYQYSFILLFNVVFTSLPVISLGGKSASFLDLQLLLTRILFSLRPSYQRPGRSRFPSTLRTWNQRPRLHAHQVLVLYG